MTDSMCQRDERKPAWVVLSDQTVLAAEAICGKESCDVEGELVFNTSFNGYTEIITDPSYSGQIVLFTHPHVGSHGVKRRWFQSSTAQCKAILVHRLDDTLDEQSADGYEQSLRSWLIQEQVPILVGLPIRSLTQMVRCRGAMPCRLLIGKQFDRSFAKQVRMSGDAFRFSSDILSDVSVSRVESFGDPKTGRHRLAVYDFGVKRAILKRLEDRGCYGSIYPWDTSWDVIWADRPDGVVLSNGPGDPSKFGAVVAQIKQGMGQCPILAICLGHQLLCQALGGQVYKLKFGHRGGNHPVRDLQKDRTLIAAHNHGFAIKEGFLAGDWRLWFRNLTDQSVAGIRNDTQRVLSVQFHPEGAPGPHDTFFVFDEFVRWVSRCDIG